MVSEIFSWRAMEKGRNWRKPMVKIYVEGGGDRHLLKSDCRKAFKNFFEKLGFSGRLPRVIPCGSRNNAYEDFCISLRSSVYTGELAFLLVDSESPVNPGFKNIPWQHLRNRDGWEKPNGATDEQVHLMVECMENWFLSDPQALLIFFGQGFNPRSLPRNSNIETISKSDVLRSLENASRQTQKGQYDKGAHSFKILEIIDSLKVVAASPSAERLINELNRVSGK
jgi:hypothetical protein